MIRSSTLRGVVLALVTAFVAPATLADDAWTQEGGDASADAFNADQTILGANNVGQLTKLWQQAYLSATDTVESDGQLFVGYRDSSFTYLTRLDPQTGASVWTVQTQEFMGLSPALTDTLAIVTQTAVDGQSCLVAAYDRITGKAAWHHKVKADTISVPRVLDGVVYVTATDLLIALDAATGKKLWQADRTASNYNGVSMAAATGVVVDGRVDSITAFATKRGRVLWRFTPDVDVAQPIMIVNDTVVAEDENGSVYAIDLSTGALRWKADSTYGSTYTGMATDGQRVFILHGETFATHTTAALDLASGTQVWAQTTPLAPYTPLVSNGVLFMPTKNAILALDTTTGAQLASVKVPGSLYRRMTLAEGKLFVSDWQGGSLYAVGLPQ